MATIRNFAPKKNSDLHPENTEPDFKYPYTFVTISPCTIHIRILYRFLWYGRYSVIPVCVLYGGFSQLVRYGVRLHASSRVRWHTPTRKARSERAQRRAWWCGPQRGPSQVAMALSEVGEHYSVAQQQVQELRQRLRERRVQLCDIHRLFSLSRIFLFLVCFISCCFFNPGRRCVISSYFQLLKEREIFARDSGNSLSRTGVVSVCVCVFLCVGLKQTQIC